MNRTGDIPPPEDDPDQTDRLPALDEDPGAGSSDVLESTGTWSSSGAELADRVAELERKLEERDAAVADLTSLLRERTFAVTRVGKDLEQARADLAHARAAAQRAEELERRLNEVERERLTLAAQYDEQRAAIARLEDQLSESSEAGQRLQQELAGLREQSDARERAREAAAELLAGSEARIAELEARLGNLTGETLAALPLQQHAELKDRLAAMQRALLASRDELRAATASRDALQVRADRLSRDVGELRDELRERERHAAGLIEQLRTAEARQRYDADVAQRVLPPPEEDPRIALLTRRLGEERAARVRAEQGVAGSLDVEREARARAEQALADREDEIAALREELVQKRLEIANEASSRHRVPARRRLTRIDPGHEAVFELAGPRVSIGRTPENDLLVLENYISRHHAVIKLGPDRAIIEDLGSRNGVYVNDRRVSRELLRDGDVVMLGKARFRFDTGHVGATAR